jgi:hypothetical membrane protein
MLAEGMAPDYSMHENAISDLGTIGETAWLFNSSLVAVGLLTIAGGYFFHRAHGDRRLYLFFIVAGIGAIGTGLIDLDNPIGLHGIFALIAFIFFNVVAISTAKLIRSPLKELSYVLGALGILFVFVMFVSDAGIIDLFGPAGHGGTERMIVYPPVMWLAVIGGYLMSSHTEKM